MTVGIEAIRDQVARLYRIEFYRKKLDGAGIRPSDLRTFEDFRRIPLTGNSEILDELKKRPSQCSLYPPDVVRINFSPSGRDLYPVYHTRRDLQRMNEVCARSLESAGVTPDDLCAITFSYHLFIAGLFYQSQLEYYGAKVIPLGPGETDRTVDLINRLGVSVLIGNPTFAMKLAAGGIPDVRILFVGGEPFTAVEGYPERVLRAFGRELTIIDSYSMALCMPIARSCRFGRGLHLLDEFVHAELIDPMTAEEVPPGEKGELVLTHLTKDASPLLRYRTGDLTFINKERCECGKELTLPRGVIGRTDEMLKIKGVKFWPSQIGTIVGGFQELTGGYRVEVDTARGVDRLELILEGAGLSEERMEALFQRLKRETLVSFDRVKVVEALEQGARVIDHRPGRTF
jgi:phenylacetate-CoA ligase